MISAQILGSFLQVQYLHVLASLSINPTSDASAAGPCSYFLLRQHSLQCLLCAYIAISALVYCATKP